MEIFCNENFSSPLLFIASCATSVDDVVTLHSQKTAARHIKLLKISANHKLLMMFLTMSAVFSHRHALWPYVSMCQGMFS